jgi:hypothetical protein
MAKPVEMSSSWKGLFAVIAAIVLAIAGIWSGVRYFSAIGEKTESRIRTEFVDPYLAAMQKGEPRTVWASLTTDGYRARYSAGQFTEAVAKVVAIYGKPKSVEITKVTSTYEPGRSFQHVQAVWKWEKGGSFTRSLQLVDLPGKGYRLDGATLDGRNVRVVPADIPANPW